MTGEGATGPEPAVQQAHLRQKVASSVLFNRTELYHNLVKQWPKVWYALIERSRVAGHEVRTHTPTLTLHPCHVLRFNVYSAPLHPPPSGRRRMLWFRLLYPPLGASFLFLSPSWGCVSTESFNGGFILVSDYVRMEVTLVGASWDMVAGDQTGVDFIPMKFCGVPSRLALGVGALSGRGARL